MSHLDHISNIWFVKILLLLFWGGLISLTEFLIYRHLLPRATKKDRLWLKAFLHSGHHPLQLYIWIITATFIISSAARLFPIEAGFWVGVILVRRLITVLFIFWFGMRFIREVEDAAVHRTKAGISKINDETSVHALSQLARVILITIVMLMLLQTAGVKMTGLLTLGGVSGAIIGFAAKDSLANFIGGMMIYWDRPFSVGDWIRSPDREIEGVVENIGWRLTRIRTFDTRPLYVPNGILSNISIENPSRMIDRRLKIPLSVRYADAAQIVGITKDIRAMLLAREDVDKTQTLYVNLTQLESSSLTILIYAFTTVTDQLKFQVILQEVLLKSLEIVAAHGAECAFPTQTLDISDEILAELKIR